MSTTDIKDVVKEKYGQAALRVKCWGQSLLRSDRGQRLGLRPNHVQSVRLLAGGTGPRRGHARLARMRKPDRAGKVESRRRRS